MTDFLKDNLSGTAPLEFLKLSQGHELLKLSIREQKIITREIDCDISITNQLKIKHDRRQDIKSISIDETQNDKQADKNKSKNADVQNNVSSSFRKKVLYGHKESMNSLANKIPDKNELHHSQFKLPFSNANEKASLVAQRERAGIVPSTNFSHIA